MSDSIGLDPVLLTALKGFPFFPTGIFFSPFPFKGTSTNLFFVCHPYMGLWKSDKIGRRQTKWDFWFSLFRAMRKCRTIFNGSIFCGKERQVKAIFWNWVKKWSRTEFRCKLGVEKRKRKELCNYWSRDFARFPTQLNNKNVGIQKRIFSSSFLFGHYVCRRVT